jgi:hypothetical protein
MKHFDKLVFTLLGLFFSLGLAAQSPGDTVLIRAFNYHSTTRDSMINFDLPAGLSYERIIMRYAMRCKDGLVSPGIAGQTNRGCGEWDYSCNTSIIDSSRTDSVKSTHPSHLISGFSGTAFNYTANTTYTYYQSVQQQVQYTSTISETSALLGAGASTDNAPFNMGTSSKYHYLYTATELLANGLVAGNLTGLGFDLSALGSDVYFLRVKIKSTSSTDLNPASPELNGFTEVYYLNTSFAATGLNRLNFHTPFNWDGTSNIIVELSFNQSFGPSSTVLADDNNGVNNAMGSSVDDHYIVFNGAGAVVADNPFDQITNQVSFAFWSYGNAAVLPSNTSIFEGVDGNNARQANLHMPWSDGSIYWDCGNDGTGYDRINRAATPAEFEGKWNHWVFTKNATTGSMKIYLNGVLWHSGTGKTKPINIDVLKIGSNIDGQYMYYGKVDEFSVWNKELTQAEIQAYMYRSIDASHPSYANLQAYYQFSLSGSGNMLDATGNHTGVVDGVAPQQPHWGTDKFIQFESLTKRPKTSFFQGTYTSNITNITVLDSIMNPPSRIQSYNVLNNNLNLLSTTYAFASGNMPIFNLSGTQVGTVNVPSQGTINISTLNYYQKRPAKYELLSFVTPYGINLDLGMEGKAWWFDVTDFQPILNGPKRLLMDRGGQWQEDIDIQFYFIVGTPPRNVVDIRQIWPVDYPSYTNILNDQFFEPRIVPTQATMYKLRSAITGHGQEGEFIPRNHFININGGPIEFNWQVWKACARNPIYPQGGTWIYDRAGWCPGMATDVKEFDITNIVNGAPSVQIDYGLTTATGSSSYIVNNQIVSYGSPNFNLDARIKQIARPTKYVEYQRVNPICDEPIIIIENTGTTALTSAVIEYSINNNPPSTYTWTGNLSFLQSAEVVLPFTATFWENVLGSNNTFTARLVSVNGQTDQYAPNNQMSSEFNIPDVVPTPVIVYFRTNLFGNESSYDLRDENDNIIFSRSNMANNTIYRDTLYETSGCFTLNVYDSDEDGLAFFANNDGSGGVQLRRMNGFTYKTFGSDFGAGFSYQFTANSPLTIEEPSVEPSLSVFPNPADEMLNIELMGIQKGTWELYNMQGQRLRSGIVNGTGYELINVDIQDMAAGLYLVRLSSNGQVMSKKVVIE